MAVATEKKAGPLETGGTLKGDKARGKDAASQGNIIQFTSDFKDARWKGGTWDFSQFKKDDGETDWDAVIDAEVLRRKWHEQRPEGSSFEEEITFRLSEIPTWVWIKRFHLPQAELINGRACMVGYTMALIIDATTHVGLVDQQFSFAGKLATFATVLGCLFIRQMSDLDGLKNLADEATFYDSQWGATWTEGAPLPEDAAPGPSQQDDLANPPKGLKASISYDPKTEKIGRKGIEWDA
eukprot:PRCOL_00003530-RA